MKRTNGHRKAAKPKTEARKSYGFIGIRPVGDIERRLENVVTAAASRGERKTVSGLVNECVFAQLPKMEERYNINGR